MNRTDYINEAQNQLDNPEYYTRLPSDPTPTYIKALKNLIRSFPEDDQTKLANAVPDNPIIQGGLSSRVSELLQKTLLVLLKTSSNLW